jgi:hypothetical protein
MKNLYNLKLICWQFKTHNYHVSGVNLARKYKKECAPPILQWLFIANIIKFCTESSLSSPSAHGHIRVTWIFL